MRTSIPDPVEYLDTVSLGEIASTQYGVSVALDPGGTTRIVGMQHVRDGKILLHDLPRVSLSEAERASFLLCEGDLLFNRTNSYDQVGKTGIVRCTDAEEAVFASYLVRLRADRRRIMPEFLNYWMNSPSAVATLRALATPGVSQFNINPTVLRDRFRVPLPSLERQAAIVAALDTFDRHIHNTRSLCRSKREFRHGLTQRLFAERQHDYSPATSSDQTQPLERALSESRVLASTGQHARKLTIKLHGRGLVAKRDTRPGSANTQYYRRSAGQFIYSKLDFLNGAFGIVPPELDGYESTLDLPAFDISDDVNPRWLLQMFSWPGFYKRHLGLANGGRKARRVNPVQLLRVAITFPPRDAQDQIADLLDACDQEIELLDKLTSALDRQKRALFPKLLSGEIRVATT